MRRCSSSSSSAIKRTQTGWRSGGLRHGMCVCNMYSQSSHTHTNTHMQSNLCVAATATAAAGRQPFRQRLARQTAHTRTRSIKSIHHICYVHMRTHTRTYISFLCIHMLGIPDRRVCKYRRKGSPPVRRAQKGVPCKMVAAAATLQSARWDARACTVNVAKCDITFKSNRHSVVRTHRHKHAHTHHTNRAL